MLKKSLIAGFFLLLSFLLVTLTVDHAPVYGADEATIKVLKDKLILANKILDMENLARPLGHISVRIPGTETFLITQNVAPGMATLDDILVCNMEGKVIEGKYPRTFSEVVAHTGVYKKRKDINSVTHFHSPYGIALSMTETPLYIASFEAIEVGTQPIAIYKKILFVDKPEIGEEIADLLGPNKAVMLKGHGALVAGKSIEETTIMAVKYELACKLQLLAMSAGKLVPFTEQEKQPLLEFLKKTEERGGTTTSYGRGWTYYESLFKK